MSLKQLASLIALPLVSGIATDCGAAGAHYKASNVTISPDPPVQGQAANLVAIGVVDEAVTGGTGKLNVLLDSVPIYKADLNTCGNTTINLPLGMGTILVDALSCPTTAKEQQNITVSLTLPSGIPSGGYTILFSGNDQSTQPVFCLNATFTE